MRLPRLTGFAFLVIVTAIGCNDPTSPAPGSFLLQSVDGRPLPAEVAPGPGGPTIVVGGSVVLVTDGTAILGTRTRVGIGGEHFSNRYLKYRLEGRRIVIEDCPPNASCTLITGELIGSRLNLHMTGYDTPTYQYRRTDQELITPN